jgi:hypothetical protein
MSYSFEEGVSQRFHLFTTEVMDDRRNKKMDFFALADAEGQGDYMPTLWEASWIRCLSSTFCD